MSQQQTALRDDLERHLPALHAAQLDSGVFLQALLSSPMTTPVSDGSGGRANLNASQKAEPLSPTAGGGTTLLILCSIPECAKAFRDPSGGFEDGILEESRRVAQKTAGGLGSAINPGSQSGIEPRPDAVSQLPQWAPPVTTH